MKQNVADYSFEYRKNRQIKTFRMSLVIVSLYFFLTIFLNCVLFAVLVNSSSMETEVVKHGVSFVCPLLRNCSRGQIVYLSRMDKEKLSPHESLVNSFVRFVTFQKFAPFGYNSRMTGNDSIRRVVALPGDTFYMKDFVIYVKPKGQDYYLTEFELTKSTYDIKIYSVPAEWESMGCSSSIPETVLGKDEYFVLADDRIEGIDSRLYGAVNSSEIKGRVLCQIFPFNKINFY